MKSFYLTDTGKVREHNEDSVIIVKNKDDSYLMVVADGMGGHSCGEVASSITVSYLAHRFQNSFYNLNKEEAITFISDSVKEANMEILKYAESHPESRGMGTTLVMAVVTNTYILIANIGDSSGLVFKKKKLYKVTYDHTLVNLLVTAGELTKEEAKNHPRKNVLMKALGVNEDVEPDIFDCEMDIDSVMLCSDGVTNMLELSQIERVLNSDIDIEDKVVKLVQKCNNRGGIDNISIAYLIREGEEK